MRIGKAVINLLLYFMVDLLGIIESWHQCLFSWNSGLLLIQLIIYILCVYICTAREFSIRIFKFVRVFNEFGTELTVFHDVPLVQFHPDLDTSLLKKLLSCLIFKYTLSLSLESA